MSPAAPDAPCERLTEAEARDLAAGAFLRCGVDSDAAWQAAAILTTAEMMGITTHGLVRVIDYTTRLKAGGMSARARPVAQRLAPSLIRIDGRNALGPVTAGHALSVAMDAARETGTAAAFVHGGTHVGALAPFLLDAAQAGFACLFTSNTAPMVAPPGGRAPVTGNMPLGIAVPGGRSSDPVFLDMALSVVSRSRIRAAAREGASIPDHWALGPDGRPTTDPARALQGLIATIGGPKGANLAVMLDLLAGGLSGARFLSEIPDTHKTPAQAPDLGYALLLVDVTRLLPEDALADRVETARRLVTTCPRADGAAFPRLPGARALESLHRARAEGLCVSAETLAQVRAIA